MSRKIGPFVLEEPLGRGGMAQVWKGVHYRHQTPVAIKILHGSRTDNPGFYRAFREEVRAVAGLEHEAIIQVYDFGLLTEDLHLSENELLKEGTPWLVMELAYDSLLPYCGRLSWSVLFPIAVRLLKALAHAHARGVIHRDIKPENILAFQHLYDIKLTDFGIAHSMDSADGDEARSALHGTPPYMAPEQFSGDWRNFGPWTDLYALGSTLFTLLTGRPPLGLGLSWMEVMARHVTSESFLLPEDAEVPPGFEEWLQTMMAKKPVDRFQRASDALYELLRIQSEYAPGLLEETMTMSGLTLDQVMADDELNPSLTLDQELDAPTRHQGMLQAAHMIAWNPEEWVTRVGAEATIQGEGGEGFLFESSQLVPALATLLPEQPPFPDMPEQRADFHQSVSLQEVGLGLVGLRAIPLIARQPEKQALWQTLKEISEEKNPQWLLLKGSSGAGKSKLARWLCESAHELGLATVLQARHDPTSSPLDGLRTMLTRYLQCTELQRESLVQRLQWMFEALEIHQEERWLALAEILQPLPNPRDTREMETRRIFFSTPAERYESILLFLQLLTEERPVIVWMDDVQWSFDSLQFLDHCLQSRRAAGLPLLLLTTVDDGQLAQRMMEQAYLSEIAQRHTPRQLDLPPLTNEAQRSLIQSILPLEDGLISEVVEKTAGNPSFAVQWLGDWVAQGWLCPREEGFGLQEGLTHPWPDNLEDIWEERLQRLLQQQGSETLAAMELAAVMGKQVHQSEWERACALSWLTIPTMFLETLLSHSLVIYEDKHSFGVWSFAHKRLREALEESARRYGRWEQHHSICAELLSGGEGAGLAERRARHLRHARRNMEALAPMRQAIQERVDEGHPRLAEALLREWEELLAVLYPRRNNRYWAEAHQCRAHLARRQSQLSDAEESLKRCEPLARRNHWEDLLIRVLLERSMLNWVQGHSDLTAKALHEAEDRALRLGDISLQAEVSMTTSELMTRVGKLDDADSSARLARSCYQMVGDLLGEGKSLFILAFVARQRGMWEQIPHYLSQAQSLFERTGAQRNLANCLNFRGDIARKQGRLEEAEEFYRDALRRMQMLEVQSSHLIILNLAMTLLKQHNYEESIELVEETLQTIGEQAPPVLIAAAWLIQLPGFAALERWEDWDNNAAQLVPFFARTNDVDVDFAEMAQMAGDLAVAGEEYDRAIPLFQLAMKQWQDLQQPDRAAQVEQRIDSLAQDAFFTLTVPGQTSV
jgi:tetratricopeptide (TPR) repeat protein/adenylylsulfate kinase-like enzyme